MPDRYAAMFTDHESRRAPVVVPFFVLGDPSPGACLAAIDAAICAGASALELGIPFSDPVSDGPAVQDAVSRAFAAGIDKAMAFDLLRQVRDRHPSIPIGLLVYANLAWVPDIGVFYREVAAAGADSVLVADVPVHHTAPFREAAKSVGVRTVLIAAPNASDDDLEKVAQWSEGYVYLLTRAGVTGTELVPGAPDPHIVDVLRRHGSAPLLSGFGISTGEHVRIALAHGARGVISGSAFSQIVARTVGDNEALATEVAVLVRELAGGLRPR